MKIFYGRGAYKRDNGNLPPLRLVNMFVEQSPADEDGVVLQSREALVEHFTAGPGPVTGVFKRDGVFGGDEFTVSGGHLYRLTSDLGAIPGNGPVSFAAGAADELLVNAGEDIMRYDGATLAAVAFPDSADVAKVLFHDGLYIALRQSTDMFYCSDVLDGSSWDALAFKSAESDPDYLLDAEVMGDMLYAFGSQTIELWANDASGASVPYTRMELATISKGARTSGCVVKMDQALGFVSNESIAYLIRSGTPERISDHGIEEQIANSSSARCFGFVRHGHSFFCVRLDDATYAYDIATRQWCEFTSMGRANFAAQCVTPVGETPVAESPLFGDDTDGKLWILEGYDEETYERLFTGAVPLDGPLSVDCIRLNANMGWTNIVTGDGSSPEVEMRVSRDAGAAWGDWRTAPLGSQGNYRTRTEWRRLGMFDEPGAMFEFRMSDPGPFRVGGVVAPQQRGGRARA